MTGARKRGIEMEDNIKIKMIYSCVKATVDTITEDKEERYNRETINNLLSGMIVEILEIMTEV